MERSGQNADYALAMRAMFAAIAGKLRDEQSAQVIELAAGRRAGELAGSGGATGGSAGTLPASRAA